MNDDWRLRIEDKGDGALDALTERLHATELEHDLSTAFSDRVVVSKEDKDVFLYAGDRAQIEAARDAVSKLAAKHGWDLSIELTRWHRVAERWEDPDAPLPTDAAGERAEHEELIEEEREEVAEGAEPQFEVRVDLPTHHDAVRLDRQLHSEGIPAVRRWKYLVVGAADEESGAALVTRLEGEAPEGSKVKLEGNFHLAWDERPPNPFAYLGGLAG